MPAAPISRSSSHLQSESASFLYRSDVFTIKGASSNHRSRLPQRCGKGARLVRLLSEQVVDGAPRVIQSNLGLADEGGGPCDLPDFPILMSSS
jgi:hypothetical protein